MKQRLAAPSDVIDLRHMGTIGGSVANNDPAADYPATLWRLTQISTRDIAAGDFFVDLFETVLEGGEIIAAVSFQVPPNGRVSEISQSGIPLRTGWRICGTGLAGIKGWCNGCRFERRVPGHPTLKLLSTAISLPIHWTVSMWMLSKC